MRGRRIFGFALALTLAVFSSCRASSAQTLVPIHIGVPPIDVAALPFYAKDLGFFKDAGFDATVTIVNNGAASTAAILGGTFDIGSSNLVVGATAHEKGLSLVMVAPDSEYSNDAPTTVCAVAKNSPLEKAKDLNGKTVGLPDLFGLPRIGMSAWLEQNGADLSSVKFVELPFSGIVPAIVAGRIDASVLVDPNLQQAVDAGSVRVLSNCFSAIAPRFSVSQFWATAAYVQAHPQVVKKFAAVMARTARWANTHHPESARILEKWTKVHVTPDMARAEYAEHVSVAEVQRVIDLVARYNMIKASFPAAELLAPGLGTP